MLEILGDKGFTKRKRWGCSSPGWFRGTEKLQFANVVYTIQREKKGTMPRKCPMRPG